MKFFSKINRGAILSLFVIICVITYLVVVAINQEQEKLKIIEVCKNYLQTEVKYNLLPEKYRVANPVMPQAELDEYLSQMEKDIKSYFSDNEQTYKFTLNNLKENLTKQAKGSGVIYELKKEITKFDSFNFNDNTVTVIMKTNTTFDGPSLNSPSRQRQKQINEVSDTFILEKINGNWKLIFSQLGTNNTSTEFNTVKVMS